MVPTAEQVPTAQIEPVKPTPKALQAHKLTLTDAADKWEHATREITRLQAELEKAALVLHDHFKRTGRRTYRDRIVRKSTGGQLYMDQGAVREELPPKRFVEGDLLARAKTGWTLQLLK
jgi:hypothetical protein